MGNRHEEEFGVDTSTPMTGVKDRPRMQHLGQYSPIPEIQPLRSLIRSAQLDPCCAISSPAVPVAKTRDILAQLQSDVHTLKMASLIRSSPERRNVPVSHRPVRFTNTAVPWFNGDACWYQHQQVFDAITKSNRWDDERAALQLFAHLEGDALNVALLEPGAQWATRNTHLSDHYSSPGRLEIYRWKFMTAARRDEEDPSMFVAFRGFGS